MKLFKNQNGENKFEKLTGNVEIDFENINVPMSESLKNFKLIGAVKKGKFVKISSKGDFGNNNYLDISMRKDKNSNKKYLEIYSDLTKPLLSEYSFFKGLSGGTLLFTSIIDDSKSYSKLKIENFKLINAPGVVKLLSLEDPIIYDLLLNKISLKDIAVNEIADMIRNMSLDISYRSRYVCFDGWLSRKKWFNEFERNFGAC